MFVHKKKQTNVVVVKWTWTSPEAAFRLRFVFTSLLAAAERNKTKTN